MNLVRRSLTALVVVAALQAMVALPGAGRSEASEVPPVTTVDRLDLGRYQGLWYEIAKIPNRFQKKCARGTTAEYTVRDDGRITVRNSCIQLDGDLGKADGVAKVAKRGDDTKLKVSFVSFLGIRPFWGDYWVIGLDPDYRWAVVGTPNRKYGWILAREPKLEPATLERAFSILEQNGYERDAFDMSPP